MEINYKGESELRGLKQEIEHRRNWTWFWCSCSAGNRGQSPWLSKETPIMLSWGPKGATHYSKDEPEGNSLAFKGG